MMSSGIGLFKAWVALVLMSSFSKSAEDALPELSPEQYFSTLQPGKASLVYFCQVGTYLLKFVCCDMHFTLVTAVSGDFCQVCAVKLSCHVPAWKNPGTRAVSFLISYNAVAIAF